MGKSSVRFKKIDDVPLTVIVRAIRRVPVKKFIEHYELTVKGAGGEGVRSKSKATTKKAAASKASREKGQSVNSREGVRGAETETETGSERERDRLFRL